LIELSGAKIALCVALALGQLGINQRGSCTITRISDGDSVSCHPYGRVRLLLIDAPEMSNRKLGTKARSELLAIMPVGTKVIAETDIRVTDQYGRLLAYLFLPGGRMVNERMAESGYATSLVYAPNVKYVGKIRAAVARARLAKRGFWATGDFVCTPRDYRAGRCT
jgi:micrococcal nuclease